MLTISAGDCREILPTLRKRNTITVRETVMENSSAQAAKEAGISRTVGSGTVGKVAIELGRRAILIELNADYLDLARQRTNVMPGFL